MLTDRTFERALSPGTVFGRYRFVRLIGEGGMGVVYEAIHMELRKRVGIKILKAELARNDMARMRFLREGEAAARIRHPHVVDVSDLGSHAGLPFLVMELLEGEELDALLRREGALDVERSLDILLPVISGVAAGHDQGVIHRDLKPQNIFLARQSTGDVAPKVLDFGVSKLLQPLGVAVNLTAAGAIYGTVRYMAPEQASGAEHVDPRSDQYTIGLMLAECLTGQCAFPGDNTLEILRRICTGEFMRPRTLRADLSPALESVILRAMSLDPAARFASLYDLGRALLPFASLRARVLWEASFAAKAAPSARAPAAAPTLAPALDPGPAVAAGATLILPAAPGEGPGPSSGSQTVELPAARAPVRPTLVVHRRRTALVGGLAAGLVVGGIVLGALSRRSPPPPSPLPAPPAPLPAPVVERQPAALAPPPAALAPPPPAALAPPSPSPARAAAPPPPAPPPAEDSPAAAPTEPEERVERARAPHPRTRRHVRRTRNNAPVLF